MSDLLLLHKNKEKSRFRYGQLIKPKAVNGFTCARCHAFIISESGFSGVHNRNHCPYCLWSRHLDLYAPGDRLSACKSLMQPIGLTIKNTRKKYGVNHGELMLIHSCLGCNGLSINRIAADDDPQEIFAVFKQSFRIEQSVIDHLEVLGIRMLDEADGPFVRLQLFGDQTSLAGILFHDSMIGVD